MELKCAWQGMNDTIYTHTHTYVRVVVVVDETKTLRVIIIK